MKLLAKKCTSIHGGISRKASVTGYKEGDTDKSTPENSQLIQHHEQFSSSHSDAILKTAVESDRSKIEEKLITGGDASKSTLTTNSISSYKRSMSPDTMLQGATPSSASISPGFSQRTVSVTSDYSSDLSFFGMQSMMAIRTSSNILIEYWWDLTPHNIHMIVINYLYDSNNRWCNQCWTFFEKKLGISRVVGFYILTGICFLYILSGDLAKLLYYVMGIGYPMYKTYITYEKRGVNVCRSWLRLDEIARDHVGLTDQWR
ncbi:hypothetical protein LOAG_04384 [Loa loa]|uniref:Uncharacterized protein n=1 Tax=Loa loa TaxID=7209 RepID=A0A1S0U247_LOALO|nr:hypothetical protein LOAG_04384 [Loa loa]EFO24097.2 hypothetical protein LOAG_04384 [Loa loa]